MGTKVFGGGRNGVSWAGATAIALLAACGGNAETDDFKASPESDVPASSPPSAAAPSVRPRGTRVKPSPEWLAGEWDRAPCPGQQCDIWVAREPERSVPGLAWAACSNGLPGCSQLEVGWTARRGRVLGFLGMDPMLPATESGPLMLGLGMLFPMADYATHDRSIEAVFDVDGHAKFAVAYEFSARSKSVGALSMDPHGVTQALYSSNAGVQRYRTSTWGALGTFTQTDRTLRSIGAGSIGGIQSNGNVVLQTLWDPYKQYLVADSRSSVAIPWALDRVRPARDGFLAVQVGGGGVRFVDAAGASRNLHAPASGTRVTGVACDRTALDDVVWVESAGTPPTLDSTVYVGSLAAPGNALVPRLVAHLAGNSTLGGAFMTASNGLVLLVPDENRIVLMRIADGATWTLGAAPGQRFTQPLWADDAQVWVGAGSVRGTGIDEDALMRIDRDQLVRVQ